MEKKIKKIIIIIFAMDFMGLAWLIVVEAALLLDFWIRSTSAHGGIELEFWVAAAHVLLQLMLTSLAGEPRFACAWPSL